LIEISNANNVCVEPMIGAWWGVNMGNVWRAALGVHEKTFHGRREHSALRPSGRTPSRLSSCKIDDR
jgi:hypothetical protein